MRNPLDGFLIKAEFLTKCVNEVKKKDKYNPSVLVLSEGDFNGLVMATHLHGYSHYFVNACRKLGIKRVVWAEDLPDGEFLLSSGEGLPKDIETLTIKDA